MNRDERMKNVERNKLVFITLAVLAIGAITLVGWFAPLQRAAGVHIVSNIGISQEAAENNSGMESVKVQGTVWNEGNITANNLTGIIIFADAAHNKVVRKNISISGDLLPNKGLLKVFVSEYTREKTVPKTDVNVTVQFDWMENGQAKNTSIYFRASHSGDGNYTGNKSYDNAEQVI